LLRCHKQGHIISYFNWDKYSDQPYPIKDKTFKKKARKKEIFSFIYTFFTSIFIFPIALIFLPLFRKKEIDTSKFFAMSINLDKEPELSPALVKELGLQHLLIRFYMKDMDKIDAYINFIQTLEVKSILLNVIQDPNTLDDTHKLKSDFKIIFQKLSPYVALFQIGSTINRSKWGFFSVNKFLRFYQVAYQLKK